MAIESDLLSSNNTNKLSPQELQIRISHLIQRSNNTNKLSPQEPKVPSISSFTVQIIQINLVLKNCVSFSVQFVCVQIIQINLVLKNMCV